MAKILFDEYIAVKNLVDTFRGKVNQPYLWQYAPSKAGIVATANTVNELEIAINESSQYVDLGCSAHNGAANGADNTNHLSSHCQTMCGTHNSSLCSGENVTHRAGNCPADNTSDCPGYYGSNYSGYRQSHWGYGSNSGTSGGNSAVYNACSGNYGSACGSYGSGGCGAECSNNACNSNNSNYFGNFNTGGGD